MIYGYARVSTLDQNLDRQKDALFKYGVDELYCEKISGAKKADRSLTECWQYLKVVIALLLRA